LLLDSAVSAQAIVDPKDATDDLRACDIKNRHVAVDENEVRFRFTGKSGKQWSLRVRDRRIAKIIKACQRRPSATNATSIPKC